MNGERIFPRATGVVINVKTFHSAVSYSGRKIWRHQKIRSRSRAGRRVLFSIRVMHAIVTRGLGLMVGADARAVWRTALALAAAAAGLSCRDHRSGVDRLLSVPTASKMKQLLGWMNKSARPTPNWFTLTGPPCCIRQMHTVWPRPTEIRNIKQSANSHAKKQVRYYSALCRFVLIRITTIAQKLMGWPNVGKTNPRLKTITASQFFYTFNASPTRRCLPFLGRNRTHCQCQ